RGALRLLGSAGIAGARLRARNDATRRTPSRTRRRPERPVCAADLGPAWTRPDRRLRAEIRLHTAEDRRGAGAIGRWQSLAPRAEVRRSTTDDDPAHRAPAAEARLAGALVDLELLLHRPVALGGRVVVDRRPAPLDRLREDATDLAVQATL